LLKIALPIGRSCLPSLGVAQASSLHLEFGQFEAQASSLQSIKEAGWKPALRKRRSQEFPKAKRTARSCGGQPGRFSRATT
jgi:hypothetical protein